MTAHAPSDLFRPEVAEARKDRLHGEIIVIQPVRTHLLTGLLVAVVALLAGWVALGSYTRNETARGILITDTPTAKIVALRPGVISKLLVREGDAVRAGQKLALIRVEQPDEQGGSAVGDSLVELGAQKLLLDEQVRLAGARADADKARLAATVNGLRQQGQDLARQIDLQEQVVDSTQESLDRIQPVMERGFVSRLDFERRRQAMLVARQQLSQLQQQFNAIAAEQRRTSAELARVEADRGSEIATARTSAHGVAQQQALAMSQRGYVLTSPVAGRVTALQAAVGRAVDGSAPLMAIVPDGSSLHAEVYAPTRAIGFVRPGQEVRLLYDAFPYQRFGSFKGRVSRVTRTVLDPREIAVPLKFEEPVYRIEVAIDRTAVEGFGQSLPLQPGMSLSANLILDRRSFGEWLLQPLNAVLKRNQ